MKTTHTKGEWKVNRLLPNLIEDESRKVIARALREEQGFENQDWDENEANAKLIASAPELLEALTEMLESYKMHVKKPNESEYVIKAEAAIKKATT